PGDAEAIGLVEAEERERRHRGIALAAAEPAVGAVLVREVLEARDRRAHGAVELGEPLRVGTARRLERLTRPDRGEEAVDGLLDAAVGEEVEREERIEDRGVETG